MIFGQLRAIMYTLLLPPHVILTTMVRGDVNSDSLLADTESIGLKSHNDRITDEMA